MVKLAFGDVVIAAAGPYSGKPRPVLIVQNPEIPTCDSVVIVPFTTSPGDRSGVRTAVEPSPENGLDRACFLEIDKVSAIRADAIGGRVGRLDANTLGEVVAQLRSLLSPGDDGRA
ncbi:MAG: type II toxin-antitoxin system PemK/MazF family toxin [Bifidobacteriaceae bacterium]|nr:type II toxin-antitoxin system PemK/MazF family toxin [Bifidobacteriaceae bacterium]